MGIPLVLNVPGPLSLVRAFCGMVLQLRCDLQVLMYGLVCLCIHNFIITVRDLYWFYIRASRSSGLSTLLDLRGLCGSVRAISCILNLYASNCDSTCFSLPFATLRGGHIYSIQLLRDSHRAAAIEHAVLGEISRGEANVQVGRQAAWIYCPRHVSVSGPVPLFWLGH